MNTKPKTRTAGAVLTVERHCMRYWQATRGKQCPELFQSPA
jgi:hypothetical protein